MTDTPSPYCRTIRALRGDRSHALASPVHESARYAGQWGRTTWRTVCGRDVLGTPVHSEDAQTVTCAQCVKRLQNDGPPIAREEDRATAWFRHGESWSHAWLTRDGRVDPFAVRDAEFRAIGRRLSVEAMLADARRPDIPTARGGAGSQPAPFPLPADVPPVRVPLGTRMVPTEEPTAPTRAAVPMPGPDHIPTIRQDNCRYCRRYRRPCGRHDAPMTEAEDVRPGVVLVEDDGRTRMVRDVKFGVTIVVLVYTAGPSDVFRRNYPLRWSPSLSSRAPFRSSLD